MSAATVIIDDRRSSAGISISTALRIPMLAAFSASPPSASRLLSSYSSSPPPSLSPVALVTARHHPHPHSRPQQQQQQQPQKRTQPSFGVCFDVDGVIARGTVGIPEAAKAFKKLVDDEGQLRVPVTFVTNSLNRTIDRANQLTEILGVQVTKDLVIQAPCPLKLFKTLHEKFCLIVGQGKISEIAKDLGFENICTIEEVSEAYPLLDMVDHDNRHRISKFGYVEKSFPRVEAIILMGEPKRWESALQIIVDLLRTDGKPDRDLDNNDNSPKRNLPVIACNMDLQFKDRAPTPRFGHGAFLVCLEALYQKLTGDDLKYTALVGKPSEITFRYAEHVLARESKRMGYTEPLKTMYLIGDTPEVDIAGSNLYQKYIDRLKARRQSSSSSCSSSSFFPSSKEDVLIDLLDPSLPDSRNVPSSASVSRQTIDRVVPLLVCTGVYRPAAATDASNGPPGEGHSKQQQQQQQSADQLNHGHRDFPKDSDLDTPEMICDDVDRAIDYILEKESFQ